MPAVYVIDKVLENRINDGMSLSLRYFFKTHILTNIKHFFFFFFNNNLKQMNIFVKQSTKVV